MKWSKKAYPKCCVKKLKSVDHVGLKARDLIIAEGAECENNFLGPFSIFFESEKIFFQHEIKN